MPRKRKRTVNADTIAKKRSNKAKETMQAKVSAYSADELKEKREAHAASQKKYASSRSDQERARDSKAKIRNRLRMGVEQLAASRAQKRLAMARLRENRAMLGNLEEVRKWFVDEEGEADALENGYEQCDATLLLDDFIL